MADEEGGHGLDRSCLVPGRRGRNRGTRRTLARDAAAIRPVPYAAHRRALRRLRAVNHIVAAVGTGVWRAPARTPDRCASDQRATSVSLSEPSLDFRALL